MNYLEFVKLELLKKIKYYLKKILYKLRNKKLGNPFLLLNSARLNIKKDYRKIFFIVLNTTILRERVTLFSLVKS